jgi:hypothetical protein
MRIKPFVLFLVLLVAVQFPRFVYAQEVDGSDLQRQVREREARVNKLTTEEQLKLRAAELKAVEDPDVKAAIEKRDMAIDEFRATLRASMIKTDPSVKPILDKVAIGVSPRP